MTQPAQFTLLLSLTVNWDMIQPLHVAVFGKFTQNMTKNG